MAYGEHVALSFWHQRIVVPEMLAAEGTERSRRELAGRQAGGSIEVTAWSLTVGWGIWEAELRRNGVEACLFMGLWV